MLKNLLAVRVNTVDNRTLHGAVLFTSRLLGLGLETKTGSDWTWLGNLSPGKALEPASLQIWLCEPHFSVPPGMQRLHDNCLGIKFGDENLTQPELPFSFPLLTEAKQQPVVLLHLPRPLPPQPPSSPPRVAPRTCRQNSATGSAPQA